VEIQNLCFLRSLLFKFFLFRDTESPDTRQLKVPGKPEIRVHQPHQIPIRFHRLELREQAL